MNKDYPVTASVNLLSPQMIYYKILFLKEIQLNSKIVHTHTLYDISSKWSQSGLTS